ncbi:MAG: sulfatase-like hydrolase/transferase [Bacteroidales bacterium]|jgi:phosphoglycerol transferase MdoB-like AlkP superfamily enzyme|nr:sulfatase-like hydrolase/transferase [Bacteroidales bacterium]
MKIRPSYRQILLKYLLALLMLALTQVVFYVLNATLFNINGFSDFANIVLGFLRYALASVSIFLLPYLVLSLLPITIKQNRYYRLTSNFLYIVAVEFLMFVSCVDMGYYRFTFKRMTSDIIRYLSIGGDFGELIPQFIRDYWLIVLVFTLANVVFIFLYRRINRKHNTEEMNGTKKWYATQLIWLVVAAACLSISIRGGFQVRPLNFMQASLYCSTQNSALVLNTPFTLYRTLGKEGVEKKEYFEKAELENLFNPVYKPQSSTWADTLFTQRLEVGKTNVVIIILESFSAEYLNIYNKGIVPSYTPFLDSLARKSIVFQGMANGKKSIDGIPAVVSSMPLLMEESYITAKYGEDRLGSIASLLRDNGYTTAFFHGGYNGSMNFNVYTKQVGYQSYFGMNEYNNRNDYDGNWGIFDEPFLQYMVRTISSFKQPFATTVFTISSHHPYTIPPQHKGRFNKGTLIVHETVGYADYALKKFFEAAAKTDWYNNTLFVITADHSSLTQSKEFRTQKGLFQIPFIIYSPQLKEGVVSEQAAQQIDIVPTISDLLHVQQNVFSFGRSAFSDKPHFYIYYLNEEYNLTIGDFMSKYREGYPLELYNIKADPYLTHNIAANHQATAAFHLNLTKAIIQQYNNRLIENKLTP